jgi:hypothetical protein
MRCGRIRSGRLRRLYQEHFLQHETEKPWVLKARQELRDRLLRAIRDAACECERARRWADAANLYRSVRGTARSLQVEAWLARPRLTLLATLRLIIRVPMPSLLRVP